MIGIFDSGAGGLSVYREIRKVLPEEEMLYFADNAWCPYGEKAPELIVERCRAITALLLQRGARAIVVACNTATSAAISILRQENPELPFVGMEPAVKPAAALSRSGVVGVLATAGTLRGEKYQLTRDRYASGIRVVEGVGKGLVELVESGILSGPVAEKAVREALTPLLEAGADVIVLGCTHYPFLREVIAQVAGSGVRIIDPAPSVAQRLREVLSLAASAHPSGFSSVTGSEPLSGFSRTASPMASVRYGRTELIASGDLLPLQRIWSLL